MRLGNTLLETAFHAEGLSSTERLTIIDDLSAQIALRGIRSHHDLADAAVAAGVAPIEALLYQYDPVQYAEAAWHNAQAISTTALSMNGALSSREGVGTSTEVAVHNLIWYGIANEGFGRYVRLSTFNEDMSGDSGKRDGYDLLFRTDRRRWKLQAKQKQHAAHVNGYEDDIIVVSPGALLKSQQATGDDIHEAVSTGDIRTLQRGWGSLLHELRTQKAPNGFRHVI